MSAADERFIWIETRSATSFGIDPKGHALSHENARNTVLEFLERENLRVLFIIQERDRRLHARLEVPPIVEHTAGISSYVYFLLYLST